MTRNDWINTSRCMLLDGANVRVRLASSFRLYNIEWVSKKIVEYHYSVFWYKQTFGLISSSILDGDVTFVTIIDKLHAKTYPAYLLSNFLKPDTVILRIY